MRQQLDPWPIIAPQQQGISLVDIQKIFQEAQAQQKTENQTLIKKITELESQMAQQSIAQTAQASAPQTVEPVRQPRGPPAFTKSEEGMRDYHISEFLKYLGLISKEEMDRDYPVKPFQRPRPQRNDNSARFDRIEEGLDETRNNVNQLADLFQKKAYIRKCGICGETGHSKGSCPKGPIAQSSFTRSYFTPLKPIVPPDSDGEENDRDGYDDDEQNRWYEQNRCYDPPVKKNSQPETYDQLLSKLSPPIRKMCLSRKAQEEESKESDEWLSSLQYLNANINDLTISESFLDTASEFGSINDPAIKALGWKADKPSNFAIKGNSKHITDSLGWYTDVPVTLKDKEDKTVTVIGNFVRIDNGETEPMLFFARLW
ncbi:hypothetical protein GLOIN_2v1778046 [Rhizophagus clarus]|uniref:CCHC-type domain-containing protein n=1 Tax=Rhizophagus clarus TaxID=94130 RepID=A0A8H3R4X0_9GLOM|nr:hypothetical protein GLOIN_2v1778046 [Rhizophagus clarus]